MVQPAKVAANFATLDAFLKNFISTLGEIPCLAPVGADDHLPTKNKSQETVACTSQHPLRFPFDIEELQRLQYYLFNVILS
jgi:hypothetical protein